MPAPTVWSALASRWDMFFPPRPARLDMCLRGLPPGGLLLDAGCSTGNLVRGLLDSGCDAWGFDLDEGTIAEAHRRLGEDAHRVVQGDLREIGNLFPGLVFDRIVCMGQTFPHLLEDSDVHAFLQGACDRLAPSGSLFIQVVSDEGAPMERRLPTIDTSDHRLHRRRILSDSNRAILELMASTPDGVFAWSIEHRRWTPDELAETAKICGLRSSGVSANESGAPWTGTEPGWILELKPAGYAS